METSGKRDQARSVERHLKRIGPSQAVDRFLARYAKLNTKRIYVYQLDRYLKWLREAKNVVMTPDELIIDNLKCVFETKAVDVARKKRHMAWMDEYVNLVLVSQGWPESGRANAATTVKKFYQTNDSPLFGDFRVSSQEVVAPSPPLKAEDIRRTLKAVPLAQRLPLLFVWQGGVEINRVLSLTWATVHDEYPMKLSFYGRKRHKKAYSTFVGRDTIEGLKLWREKWTYLQGSEPTQAHLIFMGKGGPISREYVNRVLRETALALHKQGLVENGNPSSWHSHYLRHSFETEAAHAGVAKELRGFFEGHVSDISWVYNHSDQLHEEDLVKQYLRIEPFVSLEPDKVTVQSEFAERERSLIKRVEKAEALLAELKSELGESQPVPSQAVR